MNDVEIRAARISAGRTSCGEDGFSILGKCHGGGTVNQQRVFRSDSPSEAWATPNNHYRPSTIGAGVELHQQFANTEYTAGTDSEDCFAVHERKLLSKMKIKGFGVPDEFVAS